jgi:DNA-binding FadR family transcriptional regulator
LSLFCRTVVGRRRSGSLDELNNLYDTRLNLETLAIEGFFRRPRLPLNSIRQLNDHLQREVQTADKFTDYDIHYHYELMRLSGNKYLLQAWQSMRPVMEAVLLVTNTQIRKIAT